MFVSGKSDTAEYLWESSPFTKNFSGDFQAVNALTQTEPTHEFTDVVDAGAVVLAGNTDGNIYSLKLDGGSWSLKISKNEIKKKWDRISIALLGENISLDKSNIINGISISPKKNFCIIKIWNRDKKFNIVSLLNMIEGVSFEGMIYKPHN